MGNRMTNAELLEFNKTRNLSQICLCTDRVIEDVLDEWIDKLKVGPWTVVEMTDRNVTCRGWGDREICEPFKYICAMAMYGNIQIEIIKKEYGPFMGDAFLAKKGEGLQHFKETFSDDKMDDAVRQLEAIGLKKGFYGSIGDNRFCNFDSDEYLGFSLEIGNDLDANLPDDAPVYAYTYPREN